MAPTYDSRQLRPFFDMLYEDRDWFHVMAYTETGADELYDDRLKREIAATRGHRLVRWGRPFVASGQPRPPRGFAYWSGDLTRVDSFIRYWNLRHLGVAATIGVFARHTNNVEANCIGLSAFGIDIDPKNFAALKPGATSAGEVLPEILARLSARGLRPHAVVSSGAGLHAYLLIERVMLKNEAERERVKDLWYRLGKVLGGATDKFALASVLRVPGTINWKLGEPKQVEFIAEHTDLNRGRYKLADVESAFADVEGRPTGAQGARPRRSKAQVERADVAAHAALAPWDLHVLDIALKLNRRLDRLRHRSRDGGTDRSKADFAYAAELLQLGFGRAVAIAEISASAKGRQRGGEYPESTVSKAAASRLPTRRAQSVEGYRIFSDAEAGIYSVIGNRFLKRGPEQQAAPMLGVVLARAGDGKTRRALHVLGQHRRLGAGQLGFCSAFRGEILRAEAAINRSWPTGLWLEDDAGEPTLNLGAGWPESVDELWASYNVGIEKLSDGAGVPIWSLARLKNTVKDPGAFYINSVHPQRMDEAIRAHEDDAGRLRPPSWVPPDDESWLLPRAVAKFSGRADLCIAGEGDQRLKGPHPPCRECVHTACRANINYKRGGAKTYWKQATFAALTHASYRTQLLYRPENNDFASMICDELPGFVYRLPSLTVRPGKRRRPNWRVKPLDDAIEFLEARLSDNFEENALERTVEGLADERRAAAAAVSLLSRIRGQLVKLASKHYNEAKDTKSTTFPHVRYLDRKPLLTSTEFQQLRDLDLKLLAIGAEAESPEALGRFGRGLMVLRDFCGDAPKVRLFFEHDFTRRRGGKLALRRPVDGWNELIRNRGGQLRPTVLLDATAGVDPRYLLLDGDVDEVFPAAPFPNSTIVLTSSRSVSRSAFRRALKTNAAAVAAKVAATVAPFRRQMSQVVVTPVDGKLVRRRREGKLLIITDKKSSKALRREVGVLRRSGSLPRRTRVVHFGSLRGRNDFDDYDAVYLTHLHRYHPSWYLGLAFLLRDFDGVPGQWAWEVDLRQGNKEKGLKPNANWRLAEAIRIRAMTADIYQDVMRIGIRRNPTRPAIIFLPTADAQFVVRLMRLLQDVDLVLPGGARLDSPHREARRADVVADRAVDEEEGPGDDEEE